MFNKMCNIKNIDRNEEFFRLAGIVYNPMSPVEPPDDQLPEDEFADLYEEEFWKYIFCYFLDEFAYLYEEEFWRDIIYLFLLLSKRFSV